MRKLILLASILILSLAASAQVQNNFCGIYTPTGPLTLTGDQHGAVLTGLKITSNVASQAALTLHGVWNLTVKNCIIDGGVTKINDETQVARIGIAGYAAGGTGPHDITIRHNLIRNAATLVYMENALASFTDNNIHIDSNEFTNATGPFPRGADVQLNRISGTGITIMDNKSEDITGFSYPEDHFNCYKSNGTSGSHILILRNWIRGGGPSVTGSGITVGDKGGSFIDVMGNIVVNSGLVGVQAAGGHDINISGNYIFSANLAYSGVGLGSSNFYDPVGTSGGYFTPSFNITITGNFVNWYGGHNVPPQQRDTVWRPLNNPRPTGWSSNSVHNLSVTAAILPAQLLSTCTTPPTPNPLPPVATTPINPAQLNQMTFYNEPSTQRMWAYRGTTYKWAQLVDNIQLSYFGANSVLKGLGLSISGANVLIQTGTWRINNKGYSTSSVTTLAHASQDASLSSFDLIYADTLNTLHIVHGTPAATPSVPTLPDAVNQTSVGIFSITPTSVTAAPTPITDYVNTTSAQTIHGDKTFIADLSTTFKSNNAFIPAVIIDAPSSNYGMQFLHGTNNSFTNTGSLSDTWFQYYDVSLSGLTFSKSGQPAITFKDGGVISRNTDGAHLVWSTDLPGTLGTVTQLNNNTANGVSVTWANPTTTPTPTVSLGAISPTSVNGVPAATMAFLDATSSVQTQLNGKQASLGFTAENVANKSTTTTLGTSNTLYPTQNAVKVYVDNAVSGVGAVLSVSGTTNRITSTGGTTPVIDISGSYVGQTSITTLGTIATGSIPYSLLTGTPTIPTGATPTASISFTAVAGSATSFTRSDGAAKADSTIIASAANHPTLAQLQTKLNGYELISNKQASLDSSATHYPNTAAVKTGLASKADTVTELFQKTDKTSYYDRLRAVSASLYNISVRPFNAGNLLIDYNYRDGNTIEYVLTKNPDSLYIVDGVYAGKTVADHSPAITLSGTFITASVNSYTTTVGDQFTFSFNGNGVSLNTFTDNRGGRWDFFIPLLAKHDTVSVWSSSSVSSTTLPIFSGLTEGSYSVIATFLGDDPAHTPSGGAGTSRGWFKYVAGTPQSVNYTALTGIISTTNFAMVPPATNDDGAIATRKYNTGSYNWVFYHGTTGWTRNVRIRVKIDNRIVTVPDSITTLITGLHKVQIEQDYNAFPGSSSTYKLWSGHLTHNFDADQMKLTHEITMANDSVQIKSSYINMISGRIVTGTKLFIGDTSFTLVKPGVGLTVYHGVPRPSGNILFSIPWAGNTYGVAAKYSLLSALDYPRKPYENNSQFFSVRADNGGTGKVYNNLTSTGGIVDSLGVSTLSRRFKTGDRLVTMTSLYVARVPATTDTLYSPIGLPLTPVVVGLPTDGQIPVGNSLTGDYRNKSMNGDATMDNSAKITIANSVITNAKLVNSSITINGVPTALGSSFTVTPLNTDTTGTGFAPKAALIPYQTKLQNIASYQPLENQRLSTTNTPSFSSGTFTSTSANLYVPSGTGSIHNTAAQFQIAGTNTSLRVALGGQTSTTITASDNYANVWITPAPLTTPAGTNAWLTNLGVAKMGTVTIGGSTPTNTTSFLVYGQSVAGVNKYVGVLYDDAGAGTNNTWFKYGVTRVSGLQIDSTANVPINKSSADLTAQTTAGNVTTFTVGASTATFNISGYINITAVTVDVIEMQVTYTDENSTSQTANFFTQGATSALLSAIGNSVYPPMTIRAKNGTVITVKTTLTTGTGSIAYDTGSRIQQL